MRAGRLGALIMRLLFVAIGGVALALLISMHSAHRADALGQALPTTPLAPVASSITRTVTPVADAVTPVAAPIVSPLANATAPVVNAVTPIVQPAVNAVVPTAAPVVNSIAPVVAPVVRAVAPVVDTVAPIVTPVVTPLAPIVTPLTPVVAPLAPVVSPLAPIVTPVVAPLAPVVAPLAPVVGGPAATPNTPNAPGVPSAPIVTPVPANPTVVASAPPESRPHTTTIDATTAVLSPVVATPTNRTAVVKNLRLTNDTADVVASSNALSSRRTQQIPTPPTGSAAPAPFAPSSSPALPTHDAPSSPGAGHSFPGSLAVLVAVAAAASLVAERLRYATTVRPQMIFASLIERPG
jgi:hypothetical protein